MPKNDPRPVGAAALLAASAASPVDDAGKPDEAPPPVEAAPSTVAVAPSEAASQPSIEHYLVVADLPGVADTGRVLRAHPAQVVAWLDASAVRIATPREIELAAPRFVVLED